MADVPLCRRCEMDAGRPEEPIVSTVFLCPEHKAKDDALLTKYGLAFIKRTERES